MKALILGAEGHLGGELNKIFVQANYQVVAWDKNDIDITDKDLVVGKIEESRPDIIVNAAAYNAVDKCEEEEGYEEAKKINGEAPGYLAEAALKIDALLVHYSSDYVFPGDKKEGYQENDTPDPVNKYGETKLMGEKEIIQRSGRGLEWYLIRTSKLFGPQGENENAKPSFFDTMLKLASEKEELKVVNDEISKFTYTPDLAEATKKLIEENKGCGIYHIANSGSCSWYDGVKELFRIQDIDTKVTPISGEEFARPARRPFYSVLINTKFPELKSWQEALKEYYKNKVL